MAIEYVGSQVGNRGGDLAVQTQTYALTGGLGDSVPAAGDLVVIALVTSTNNRTPACHITVPATWTHLGLVTIGSAPFDTCLDISYKFMPATPNTVFQTPPSGHADDSQSWTVHVYRGVDTSNPIDVAPTSATDTGTTRGNPPPILPITEGALIFVTVGGASGTAVALVQPGELSGFRQTTHTSEPNDSAMGSGHILNWTSAVGTVNASAYTGGSANANDSWASYVIALRPAAPLIVGLSVNVRSGNIPRYPIMGPPLPSTWSRFVLETLYLSDADLTARTGVLTRVIPSETLHVRDYQPLVVRVSGEVLTWDPVFGAADYRIEVGSTPGASNVLVTHTASATPSYTLSLPPGTYYVRIYSVPAEGGDWQTNYGPPSEEEVVVI